MWKLTYLPEGLSNVPTGATLEDEKILEQSSGDIQQEANVNVTELQTRFHWKTFRKTALQEKTIWRCHISAVHVWIGKNASHNPVALVSSDNILM